MAVPALGPSTDVLASLRNAAQTPQQTQVAAAAVANEAQQGVPQVPDKGGDTGTGTTPGKGGLVPPHRGNAVDEVA